MATQSRSTADAPPALDLAPALEPGQIAWPRALSANVALMLSLVGSLAIPLVAAGPPAVLVLLVSPVLLISAMGTRVLFESLTGDPERRKRGSFEAAAGLAALLGQGLILASMFILSLKPLGLTVPAGVLATLAVLSAATLSRRVELRYWGATRRVFFVGPEDQARDLGQEIAARGDLRLIGAVSLNSFRLTRNREGLESSVLNSRATTLVISPDAARDPAVVSVAFDVNAKGMRVRELVDFYEEQFGKVPLSALTPSWFLFDVAEIHRPRVYGGLKRLLDVTAAAIGLLGSLPVTICVAIAVRLDSRGSPFFLQPRVGKDGHVFRLIKFRTMHHASERASAWGTDDEHRITRLGRWLRRYRLDELPQLWNVLKGDLSLVGPRAEQPEIVDRLGQMMEFYSVRHRVRPGVTGWAQVNYGYGGSVEGAREKLQYDFFYMKRQSLHLDLLILASTIRTILAGTGR